MEKIQLISKKKIMADILDALEKSPHYAFFLTDLHGMILTWNKGATLLFGYEKQDVVDILNFDHLKLHQDVTVDLSEKIKKEAQDKGKWEGDILCQQKNGHTVQIHFLIKPLFEEQISLGFFIISHEVKDHQNGTHQPISLNCPGINVNNVLEGMNHELRTPLNSIIGYTELLLMKLPGPLNAAQEKHLQTVDNSAKHLLLLINNMLETAKQEQSKTTLKFELISCNTLLQEWYDEFFPLVEKKKLSLKIDFLKEDILFLTDKKVLQQIIKRLMDNAIKFTDIGKIQISVNTQKVADIEKLCIHIIDTGKGIRKDEQKQIMDKLKNKSVPTDYYKQGDSVGLHLSNQLIQLIDGSITFESQESQGSRFTIQIPLKKNLSNMKL